MKRPRLDPPRIWRSAYSAFAGDDTPVSDLRDETVTANAVYTDAVLAEIAAQGFNAIWVHGRLRHMVPSSVFPEFGPHWRTHVRKMRALAARAARHGLRVYVYMQPPRGMPSDSPFWDRHPDVRGAPVASCTETGEPIDYTSVCTSTRKVKKFLRESSERLFREVRDLGGVILITASEFAAHCYSRYSCRPSDFAQRETSSVGCPRCRARHPADVVVEVIRLVRGGVRAASRSADVIAWNWSWTMYEKDPCADIIGALPRDVILMAGFERGGRKRYFGKMRQVDEYSLSYAGPSRRFLQSVRTAREQGLRVIAKLQVGTTHELAVVPNLPLIGSLYDKVKAMRRLGIDGFMGCWNFGNMPTANSAAFNWFLRANPLPSRQRALRAFAEEYFPGCDAPAVVRAWRTFEGAMGDFPFCIPFLYTSPVNYSLAYPLRPRQAARTPLGRSWMPDPRGEWAHPRWTAGFEFREFRPAIGCVAKAWRPGARALEEALRDCTGERVRREVDNAWVCYHIFRSTWNTYRVFDLRKNWNEAKRPAYLRIIEDELAGLEHVLPAVQRDRRFGWHSECQTHLFDADGIRKKIRSLRRQVRTLGGANSGRGRERGTRTRTKENTE